MQFKQVAKIVSFIVFILLLGQITVSKRPIGGHVSHGLKSGLMWGVAEWKKTKLHQDISNWEVLTGMPKKMEGAAPKVEETAAKAAETASKALKKAEEVKEEGREMLEDLKKAAKENVPSKVAVGVDDSDPVPLTDQESLMRLLEE